MTLELVTYADLKSLMNLEKAAITDYPPLGVINTSMITAFEEYLGRKLNNESRTETQHIGGFARYMIRLPAVPITAMTSVTVTEGGIATVWTETDDYDIMGYGIKLFVPIKNCKIVIVYTGGLSAVSEEPNLNRAALYQIAYEFQRRDHIGAETVSNEGGSVTWPELGLLKETKRMLNRSIHPLHMGGA